MKSRLCQDVVNMTLEDGSCENYEVKMDLRKILDDKPITTGIAILQYSKLLFLKFIMFLADHLEPNSFTLCYADTDSIALGNFSSLIFLLIDLLALTQTPKILETDDLRTKMSKMFNPIIQSKMHDSFFSKWGDYFVLEDTIEQKRKPGLLKGILA